MKLTGVTKIYQMSDGAEVIVEPRYRHPDDTVPMEGWFNVLRKTSRRKEHKFIGCVYKVGSEWQWGGSQFERCASFDKAVQKHVDQLVGWGRG